MTAPTMVEVREALETARQKRDGATPGASDPYAAEAWALTAYALPIAEHRDALAAEVARLSECLQAKEARFADLDRRYQLAGESVQAHAAEVARLRSVLGSIATLDESDTDDLTEALTDWDIADVYGSLVAAITSARMALDDAAKGAGR